MERWRTPQRHRGGHDMNAPNLTPKQLAEQSGAAISLAMLDAVANSTSQEQAISALHAALNEAFNHDDDPIISAVAGGFAVTMVNVLERGLAAIRTGGVNS